MPLLGALGPSLDGLGLLLGGFGTSWEGLGGLLGRSWGLLDPLGTVLAAILGPTNHKIENQSLQVNGRQGQGSILAPKMGPKTTPRRPQNETKNKMKNASLFDRSWTRLGPVLRPSWVHLGAQKVVLVLCFPMFREHRLF